MAGHSKWANIKHRKGRQDAKRSKMWSKCARAIIVAAKQGGGDPAANLTLRYAIDEAKAVNMPKDTIENAVKKGTGELGGEAYEPVVYEGYGPGGAAVMLDCLTDNKNRTVPEIRKIFEKHGGNLGASGCVAYNFRSKGQLFIAKRPEDEDGDPTGVPTGETIDEESVMMPAVEAGAEDVIDDGDPDGAWQVLCDPGDFEAVRDALRAAKLPIAQASVTMVPDSTIEVTGRDAERFAALLDTLEDHDDVQKVHTNAELPDEVAA